MRMISEIGQAIETADNSLFRENYSKQAEAVLRHIDKKGYVIVPKKATDDMLQAGEDAIQSGKVLPKEHVGHVYTAMVISAKRAGPSL